MIISHNLISNFSYILVSKIQYFYIIRIDSVPKSLHSIAKELFRLSVCLKPRLIHTGIERIKNNINSEDIVSEQEVLGIYGKFRIEESYDAQQS